MVSEYSSLRNSKNPGYEGIWNTYAKIALEYSYPFW